MKSLRYFWRSLKRRLLGQPIPKRTIKVEELPNRLHPNCVYVAGEGAYLWFVAMLCPCGCRATLYLSLMPEGRPRWHLTEHKDGTITLHPSVWRTKDCRSHFFLQQGLIQWCKSTEQ
ncbi:MAG: hypothetical protein F6K32_00690 [Desertifilum sp. SIO1I2]|nr:hypothetical protein [Desertifilum sp. SIO1I2]